MVNKKLFYIYFFIYFIQKLSFLGSCNTRCMTAVSSFNLGPEYIRQLHKQATKESPGKFTKLYISKLSKNKIYSKCAPKSRINFGKT